MAIDIKFDLAGNPEPPTIILATRNGNKLGQLEIDHNDIELSDKLSDISEFSFILNKYVDGKLTNLWDKVVNFKLVYCKEWDMWFEIRVELDEATETVKTVFCTQLGQAELSQIMIYNMHINEEGDSNWSSDNGYKTSILYDENDPKASILNRLLDKAPHYSIEHVDFTIANIQRSFSFDDTSICDAFNEIAEEIGCLFVYNSNSDDNGKIKRTISVYDLQQKCLTLDCGYRGEFTDVCPKCGGTDIKYGYGKDTTIFVTSDELASEGIQLTTDTESVKNCFKLEAGDDLMTATIRNCNPNGTDYIWYFSESTKEDMPDELVERLESYDELYKDYYDNHESHLNASLVEEYNALVEKYKDYYNTKSSCLNCGYEWHFEDVCPNCGGASILSGKALQTISSTIKGYSPLMNTYYNVIDLGLYLESALMPTVEMDDTYAEEQAVLLKYTFPSTIAVNVDKIESISKTTADSAALSMAKVIVKSTYKVEIDSSTYDEDTHVWTGNFSITNYSDDTDKYPKIDTDEYFTVTTNVNNDEETFIKQKIEKTLNKDSTDDYSVVGLFKKDYDDFCAELKKYALNPLKGFYDSCDACINILIDNGAGSKEDKPDLYEKLYVPYHNKSIAISNEIKIREKEIAVIEGVWDKVTDEDNPELITKGLQQYIEECRNEIQSALNFENYLGEELWVDFCAYRRECKYSNENYISDGLDNAKLFARANEFIDTAKNEIYKSAELQHSISTTLNNLLAIPKFKPLVKHFKVGNWIRVRIDDKIYRLRLLEYTISYGNLDKIDVEFSDVTKVKDSASDIESILSQASSMASSYDSVQKQAKQGNEALGTIDEWLSIGLNTALVQIQNNSSEDIIINKNGILGRSYNEITDTYSPEQLRITHNILAYTTDNWKTVSSALGKHEYIKWQNNQWVKDIDYGLTSKFVSAGYVTGSQIIGGEIVSSNYKSGESGTYFNLIDGDFEIAGGNIVYDTNDDTLTLRNVTIEWANTNAPEVTVNDVSGLDEYLEQIGDIEDQLDGRAQTWYQDVDPSVEWTTDELKALHVGDLWHYTGETGEVNGVERIKNSEWIWQEVNGSYQWVSIEISDAVFDVIDGKAQIFTSTPVPPYYVGDLWVQGSSGDIKHCITPKAEGESFNSSDWAKSSKYTDDTSLDEFISGEFADELAAINSQIDKKAETWYQATDPSVNWTTDELKALHVGDLWFDTDVRRNYVYNASYNWEEIDAPQEVYDLIDGKADIYVSLPPSQKESDLLIPLKTFSSVYNSITYTFTQNKIYRCTEDSETFRPDCWSEVEYIDKTEFEEFKNEYDEIISSLQTQVDGKSNTYYQATEPHPVYENVTNEDDIKTYDEYVGDLWYDTDNGKTFVYQKTDNGNGTYTYTWEFMDVPNEIFDAIDGKSSIYVKLPENYEVNDMYILEIDRGSWSKGTLLVAIENATGQTTFVEGHWQEFVKYTDDTRADEAYKLANTANSTAIRSESLAQAANDLGGDLKKCLGFNTEIAEDYVISPVIGGGYLLIGDKTGVYAEITTGGILNCNGANIIGNITANSLTLGSGVSVPYSKISDAPTIPTKLSELTNDLGLDVIEGTPVVITEEDMGDGIIKTTTTVGDNEYTTYTSADGNYILTNLGLGTESGDHSTSFFKVSTDGLLIANNAMIWGTIYATAGKFTGDIVANSLTLGNNVSIEAGKVNGLSDVATSGNYNDLIDTPTIPASVADLGFDTSSIVYKGDISQSKKTDSNGIEYLETTVPTSNGNTITYSTYDAEDYMVFGRSKGTNSGEQNYVCISKEGLLTARNAWIYGTIYATDGEIGGCSISEGILKVDGANITSLSADKITTGTIDATVVSLGQSEYGGFSCMEGHDGTSITKGAKMYGSSGKDGNLYIMVSNKGAVMKAEDTFLLCSNGAITASNDLTISSDRRVKHDISYELDCYEDMFHRLKPSTFYYNGKESNGLTFGFIAQDVEQAIEDSGYNIQDYSLVDVKQIEKEDGTSLDSYALAKTELIALNTHMIQKLYHRVAELEEKLELLES